MKEIIAICSVYYSMVPDCCMHLYARHYVNTENQTSKVSPLGCWSENFVLPCMHACIFYMNISVVHLYITFSTELKNYMVGLDITRKLACMNKIEPLDSTDSELVINEVALSKRRLDARDLVG